MRVCRSSSPCTRVWLGVLVALVVTLCSGQGYGPSPGSGNGLGEVISNRELLQFESYNDYEPPPPPSIQECSAMLGQELIDRCVAACRQYVTCLSRRPFQAPWYPTDRMCARTYVDGWEHARACVRSRMCVRACVGACLSRRVRACVGACVRACIRRRVRACITSPLHCQAPRHLGPVLQRHVHGAAAQPLVHAPLLRRRRAVGGAAPVRGPHLGARVPACHDAGLRGGQPTHFAQPHQPRVL